MLVIIESPKKAKKISEYSGAKVLATVGHFMDLPEDSMGIHPVSLDPDFRASSRGREIIDKIKAASVGEDVIIATDPDREGYAIGMHVYEIVKSKAKSVRRAEIREVSKPAVQAAIAKAVPFAQTNHGEYDAFLGRRVGDRVVGYTLSPAVSKQLSGKFSVGRVQSPAVGLVVALERKISAFNSEPYWDVTASIGAGDKVLTATHKNNPFRVRSQIPVITAGTATVTSAVSKAVTQNPKPPFSTVDLQSAASAYLKIPPETTQSLAQDLFAAGLCTYIRTDSFTLSEEWTLPAQAMIRSIYSIVEAPALPVKYKAKNSQAEAHEAIRPSGVYRMEEIAAKCAHEGLSDAHTRLMELIWRRAVASQMSPAVWGTTTLEFDIGGEAFIATGKVLQFEGFRKVWIYTEGKDEILPMINRGTSLPLISIEPVEKKTKAPGRYSEAALLKDLETKGVGRPSTYATIIQSIKAREYVEVKKGFLHATQKGEDLIRCLEVSHPWVIDCGFTSIMEGRLDKVEANRESWRDFISELIQKVGGLKEGRAGGGPLSDKQKSIILRNGDDAAKKALEDGDDQSCRLWLDNYFKGFQSKKTSSTKQKKSPSKSRGPNRSVSR